MSLSDVGPFDFADLAKRMDRGNIIVCTGDRCTGKSTMLKHVARHLHAAADTALAMSNWACERRQFCTFMSADDVHDYDAKRVAAIVAEQRQRIEENKPLKNVVILIDGAPCGAFKDKTMRQLFYTSRHWNITLAFTVDSVFDVPPDMRSTIDFVCAFSTGSKCQKKLFDNYGRLFPTFQAFDETFRACTTPYECLVLDNRGRGGLKDSVFRSGTHAEHANEAPFHLGEPAPAPSPRPNVEDILRQLIAVCEALTQAVHTPQAEVAKQTSG